MTTPAFTNARALAEFADRDPSAESRIVGIAMGTVYPVATILRALREVTATGTVHAWHDLADALHELYHDTDDGDAMNSRDLACEALNRLMDLDYDGCGKTPNEKF